MSSVAGRVRGCARGLAVGTVPAASVIDLMNAKSYGEHLWAVGAVLAVGTAAVLRPADRRPRWLTEQVRTAVPALLSLLYTAVMLERGESAIFGPGEVLILLCLLFLAVRHAPGPWAVVCAVVDTLALFGLPVRYLQSYSLRDDDVLASLVSGLLLAGIVAGLAGYLRTLDYRRVVAVGETRRAERVAIAADLHDFVAHRVTGILVQTQVARMMADAPQRELDSVLAGIERAATEALASMRRTVGVLRDVGPEAVERRPVGDLDGIFDLVDRFAVPGQRAILHRDPELAPGLPHEVQAAAYRVVQESLTNVRRHAADATEILVTLFPLGDRLVVIVQDDGHGGVWFPAEAHGGGFGLVSLKERVTALGGELTAGPRQGEGWEVRAEFPTEAKARTGGGAEVRGG
ncbi:sensor histidine kinase [Streptomyces roseirectus]|uniref:histidine kinase n=1 Tax=Streptomyces roseirectus TaxID=2768066 RepID=A0A7H0I8C3_9ACTN|nr:sensor histidine kinase [Streptomyces roseirectus]QNP69039.1 sensor histidine kinase [Streptomyces roseirectus]